MADTRIVNHMTCENGVAALAGRKCMILIDSNIGLKLKLIFLRQHNHERLITHITIMESEF